MPVVVITPESLRHKPGPHTDLLERAGFEVRYPVEPTFARGLLDDDATVAELESASATIASNESYAASILARLPNLRVIARCGVGYDRVDVEAATDRGIAVTITPGSNHEAVAEMAIALIFAVAKSLVANDRRVRAGEWSRGLLQPVRGSRLGIMGLGRIGKSLAVRARALGMTVAAHDAFPDTAFADEHRVTLVDFETLLSTSDFLSIHCPLMSETESLFNGDVFSRMKQGSVLINTSRGRIVDEDALLDALQTGPLRAAGLDVYRHEPPPPDHPLFKLDNVVLSPHLAGTDTASLAAMALEAAGCIARLSRNEWPAEAALNGTLEPTWRWQRDH